MTAGVTSVLLLGFVLGTKHAFETDHVAAVATIVSEQRSIWRSSVVGILWGAGHTTALLAAGLLILAFRLTIPPRLALFFELLVGLMLVGLGLQAIGRSARGFALHRHRHGHDGETHTHLHLHVGSRATHTHAHLPFLRRSFGVGLMHGLAGSGALTLLVLAAVPSLLAGVGYILLFGVGSVLGMVAVSLVIGLPIALAAGRFGAAHLWIQRAAGALSVGVGGALVWGIMTVLRT